MAGRLGHGGGGTTTLRTYTAWVSEADQRAARGLGAGMPRRPTEVDPVERVLSDPRHPYERVAAAVVRRIESGDLRLGALAPATADLAAEHSVSLATVGRAMVLLKEWGYLTAVDRGRARFAHRAASPSATLPAVKIRPTSEGSTWSVRLRGPRGLHAAPRLVRASLDDPGTFRPHLIGIARIEVPELPDAAERWISSYELEIRKPDADGPPILVLRWD